MESSMHVEQVLTGILAKLLDRQAVSPQDNFFALGGDSIVAIQLVARARQQGYSIKPRQVFATDTIAELAGLAEATHPQEAATEQVVGEAGLSPIQIRFLQKTPIDVHHYNQSLLVEIPGHYDIGRFKACVPTLLKLHDVLRASFSRSADARWHQYLHPYTDAMAEHAFVQTQISGSMDDEAFQDRLEDLILQTQSQFDLGAPPLIRFHFIHRLATGERFVLMVAHHLVVDAVSWSIVLDDLEYLYSAQLEGVIPQLPPKSASYRAWTDALLRKPVPDGEREFWRNTLQNVQPLHLKNAPNATSDIRHFPILIDADTTTRLNRFAQRNGAVTVVDVLMTAITSAIGAWSGSNRISLMLEDNGRTVAGIDHDNSRTVGWYTSIYPVNVEVRTDVPARENLASVTGQLRRVPESGITYGLARYVSDDAQSWEGMAEPTICFNYFGRLFGVKSGTGNFLPSRYGELVQRSIRSSAQVRPFLLEIVANQTYNGLLFDFAFSNAISNESIESLAHGVRAGVEDLVESLEEAHARTSMGDDRSDEAVRTAGGAFGHVRDEKRDVEAVYGATKIQTGILFHCQRLPSSGVYVPQHAIEFRVPLDAQAFRQAWQGVLDRNSVLRTAFRRRDDGSIVQVVLRDLAVCMDEHDWQGCAADVVDERFQALLRHEWLKPFDFSDPPLMRMSLVRIEAGRYRFVWTYHHSIIDGWSGPIVLREFVALYEQLVGGRKSPHIPRRPFSDYVAWLERQDFAGALEFWKSELVGYEQGQIISKALRTPGRAVSSPGRHDRSVALESLATEALVRAAKQQNVTLSVLCQAAWVLLLYRYTGEKDVLFGLTVSGRPAELDSVETMVGQFINTLPIRQRVNLKQPVASFLRELQDRYIGCNERSFVPLADVQAFLSFDRAVGPLDTLVVFENYPADVGSTASDQEAACSHLHSVSQNNYPLSLVIVPDDKLRLTLKYSPECFDSETIEDVLGVYAHILCELGRTAKLMGEATLADIPLSSPVERNSLIRIASGEERQYPTYDFATLFRELASAHPRRNALMTADPWAVMSYAELSQAANRLANFLIGELPAGSIVGLCLPRGVDQVVGMLACLKSGMPYVPLDPAYPASRVNRLIENARLAAVITDTQHIVKVSDSQREILLLDLDAERELIDGCSAAEPDVSIHPEQTAYIIYTSGSTGGPKGVSVPHRALMNYIHAVDERLMLSAEATLAHLSSVAADLGYTAVFGALGTGRCLRLLCESKSLDAPALAEELGKFPVDCLKIVPSHLIALMSTGNAKRVLPTQCLVMGGESPSKELVDSIRACAPDLRVINHYGPTETTVGVCTHGEVSPGAPRTIGRPLSNMHCHVLNELLEPAGFAAEGHLYLAGPGTSNGYLDSPRATAQAFLPNPYATSPGARMYRSGDRASYDRRGHLVFLGRKDSQIKIRGYRVEVAEIESCLRSHEGIVDAAVECRESSGRLMLVAYVVGAGTEAALKSHLKAELPEHMQPHFLVWLEKMPLTPNGKLDRRALPAPSGRTAQSAAPKSPLELTIAGIWADALRSGERPPADVNFFDLGGDSLSLMKVHARIAGEISSAVQITDLFTHATIAKLASFIEQLASVGSARIIGEDRAAQARAALQADRDRARQRRHKSQRDVA